jgi:esterase/lipase
VFEYFPGQYSWSLGALMALQLGGELTEIDSACAPLREIASRPGSRDDPAAQREWVRAWSTAAERAERLAQLDEAAGHPWSAGRKYRRACIYWFTAERMASHKEPAKLDLYHRMRAAFAKTMALRREPVEFVSVAYGQVDLPALFYRAPQQGPRPCMIHFDGFDVTKEWMMLSGIAEELGRRGISTLMVDHPGVGAALRLLGLPAEVASERWAAASLDYLATRSDTDVKRIGVIAMSLGGFYAPRAAAFEKRLACCVAWGARWDNEGSHGRILRDPAAARSVSGWVDHALWYYGARSVEECAEKISLMTLAGIANRITCPLLVVHGANDRQVPVEQAERTIREAVNSPRRELKLFTEDQGGVEHCQGELFSIGIDWMADWVADVLSPSGT